jgi:UPF0271 protein
MDDGSLMPRSQNGAVIEDLNKAVQQALQIITEGKVTTAAGKKIKLNAGTICLHGDGIHAAEFAKAIHDVFLKEGVLINKTETS